MILVEVPREVIKRLQAELAEARAQIADLQHKLDETDEERRPEQALIEARAQIAAKDIELAELKGQWERLLAAYDAAKARSEH